MIDFLNFSGGLFIIILGVSVYFMFLDLKNDINNVDEFYRPKLNGNINHNILGIILCSILLGGILSINILSALQ